MRKRTAYGATGQEALAALLREKLDQIWRNSLGAVLGTQAQILRLDVSATVDCVTVWSPD